MRNPTLHKLLQGFVLDTGARLTRAAAEGDEVPFELVQTDGGRRGSVPLYCYRALTGDFIRARLGLLTALPTYVPAVRALEGAGGTGAYLRARGESIVPGDPRERADGALRCFVARVFDERNEFAFDPDRFQLAYGELERTLYQGRCVTEVVAPLRGLELDPETAELTLGDGLSLTRPEALVGAPAELASAGVSGSAASDGPEASVPSPPLLIVLRTAHEWPQRPPVSSARSRFRLLLTALRLFEPGGYAIGPKGYARTDDGVWTPVTLVHTGRPRLPMRIDRDHEDELRAFINLIARRTPAPFSVGDRPQPDGSGAGELAWALARYEMGCERLSPFEALSDYLLALRALLEPEGPASGRLAQRLAVICAPPEERAETAVRAAHAISLERAVIAGLAAASPEVDVLVDELAEHLRAILRDVICGHLDLDIRGVADELLAEAANGVAAA